VVEQPLDEMHRSSIQAGSIILTNSSGGTPEAKFKC
jgi:hypothetical protein